MKEVQITELTKKVNEFRKENIGKQYSSKELYNELYKLDLIYTSLKELLRYSLLKSLELPSTTR